ncbi:uncharacterized protein LOC113871376 [Abrus precatorius]|uniref:Uncharacterized protein LOC113871376 n=1 Tax=Abrus precatorius TaxID=3816 RepID=A0A8B8MB08_ABRPR|nr:uncharacterized protein LOC113871376 [Abrus precatorius]
MASSSNQEKSDNCQTEPPLTTHSPDKHADPASPATTYSTHPPPYPPPHPMCYPPTGYPTGQNPNPYAYPQGYTSYPTGYPGYQYPPNAPYYGPPPTPHTSRAGTRFYRSFILCCCTILTCLFLASFIIALVLRPELPVYKVVSFSVTNFSTSPALAGQWDSKLTIENPNDKLVAYFSDLKVDVLYRDALVDVNYARGFVLNRNAKVDVDVTGSSSEVDAHMFEKSTMDELIKERGTGSVTFALKVSSMNVFRSGSISTRNAEVVAICEGLKVVFQNNNSNGTLDNGGKPIECQLYV